MVIKFSIPLEIEADTISSFSDITEQIDKLELNKRAFEKTVYLLDDKKTSEIAGEKYSRQHQGICSRAGTTPFSVLTVAACKHKRLEQCCKISRLGLNSKGSGIILNTTFTSSLPISIVY